ncbi:hypothetical protein PN465_08645 [Nodularia spumigena CS-584]|jgi:outer membrane biosynthesis protein TonB|uniref:Type II secretion system protein GspC N-terminal domain-containing protein n=2 Tax=Nodularia spumigena TaxID=70799 RepID=A0A2S0QAU1_NODSP|nr:hypothetical protein [Nodularia spumigena]AHJ29127.1 hypothetical protein NSP_27990 [Nodularia spumigena CCY9414]AVZ31487.1 hypothetical protein BMF81_04262 [Nodularia spumigena UHCC 0039]EAW45910.1 hypothetical protein N9414_15947 [Nodularia spumigena CCY9414]MDB9382290.1 hypothetical protein [Nodularia spumigena CS-584]MEA5525164.1 hypothetical protein [Nodularia spumigena UHCC 0143]
MLQAARTHLIIPELSEDLITNEPWSIDFYADGLMDELFADIDEILNVSENLPDHTLKYGSRTPRSIEQTAARDWFDNSGEATTPVGSEYDHLQTINVPQVVLGNSLTRTGKTISISKNEQVGTVVVNKSGAITKHQKTRLNLRKLLIAGAAIAGTIYIVQSGLLTLLTSRLTEPDIYLPQTQTQLSPPVDAQADLVNYMLGALAMIEKQEKTSNGKSADSKLANGGVSNSSPVAGDLTAPLAANNTQPIPSRSTNVVERIYIPVYQAPSPMRYAPPPTPVATATQPQVATNSPTSQPESVQTPAKPVRPEIKPVTVQSAPITVKPPSVPVRPPSPPTDTPQQAYLQTPATSATHTLAGLMELGDKSAALFEFEGVTRRVHMGESIGATGWTLVDVANGEAIVRRNGEVRSIFAGQKL